MLIKQFEISSEFQIGENVKYLLKDNAVYVLPVYILMDY